MPHDENGAGASRENAPDKEKSSRARAAFSESLPLKSAPIVDERAPADKAYATLAARYALAGHALVRSDRADGPISYYATRWGSVKVLRDLQAAADFLVQITGMRHE
jgi:hypothetical protein